MDESLLVAAIRHLRQSDSIMAQLIKRCDPLRLTRTAPPHYHSLVCAIINQQLSVKAGRTIEKRLQEKHGGRYFNAQKLLKLKPAVIRDCGLSNKKVHYVRTLAQAITSGELNFRKLAKQQDDDVRHSLTHYPGIGPWTADMFLISALRRVDVFPVGDLVIRQTMQRHYQLSENCQHDKYITIASNWQPYRSIASHYLWKSAS